MNRVKEVLERGCCARRAIHAVGGLARHKKKRESTHKVRVTPGLPDGLGDLGVCIAHHPKEVISAFLGLFFDLYALGFEIFAKLVVIPGRVDIVLCVIQCTRNGVSDAGCHARESLGGLMSGVGVSGTCARRVAGCGIGIGVIPGPGKVDEFLLGTFGRDYPLFEEELSKVRLVPLFERSVADVSEHLLSVGVLVVSPGSREVPMELDKLFQLWVGEPFVGDGDLVVLEPSGKLFGRPSVVRVGRAPPRCLGGEGETEAE